MAYFIHFQSELMSFFGDGLFQSLHFRALSQFEKEDLLRSMFLLTLVTTVLNCEN